VGLRRPGLVVTVAVRPPSLAVTADAERLHQALTNLVDNAAQHGRCAAGEPVAVHLLAGGAGAAVELRVVDDGPGVPEEERESIFERFYRADRSRAPSGGAGLGLAIARWVVELHGGSLRCLTPAGTAAGTEMLLTLPARTPTDAGSVCSSAAVGTPQ
jgi:signal transduction histidine kinase